MRSIRSCNRARTTERGFALLWAIGLAVLFFMLIQLILIDSAQELTEAQRFRSRVVAMVLAENGAELAAKGIKDSNYTMDNDEDWQGKIYGRMSKNDQTGDFKIYATGETVGIKPVKAEVEVQGNVTGGKVRIDFTKHKP